MARHKKPTKKQIDALTLIKNGLSPTQAMRQVGYSESSIRIPKQALLKSAGVQSIIEVMQGELLDQDITGIYLANKLSKLAKSDNTKDFIAAYDRIAKIMGIEKKEDNTPKRSITYTEWLDPHTEQG